MKKNLIFKTLLLAVAALGLTGVTRAADATVPASGTMGLLGQTYAGLTYSYIDLDKSSAHADDYHLDLNQSLKTGLDGLVSYDFTQTGSDKLQAVMAGLRAFSSSFTWGKPYVEAGAGFAWERFNGGHDNSLIWQAGTGVEFQVAPALVITPYVKYVDTPDLNRRDEWDYGVKANYWVDSQWALTGGVYRDSHQNMGYTVGTNFRF